MNPIPKQHASFWASAQAAVPSLDAARFYESFAFGDSVALADELAALVLSGRKRATAGLLWAFEAEGKALPRSGDLSIVTSGAGVALAVIETVSVQVLPFDAVSAEFAATEGEGEATLASWRRDHRAFFGRECARLGRTMDDRVLVVAEVFRQVHPPAATPP